ncbi:MAG: TonB-dependent receptor [Tannerella sp.]|jgi:TonB-linked SusC/RagA family outer membrane protein|nr:TonB-dependent receptor [Tannerella sp.]
MRRKTLFLTFLLSITISVCAQKVTLDYDQVKLDMVFKSITQQTGLKFAYTRPTINPDRIVSIKAYDEDVRSVLTRLINPNEIEVEITSDKILLKPAKSNLVAQSPQDGGKKKTVTGTVVDETGEPVIGANIVEKGVANGTSTNSEGYFTITVSPEAVLQISYIGYTTQEISVLAALGGVGGKSLIIKLLEDNVALEEIVVVGYGTQKKLNVVGSIAQISSERLENRPVGMLSNALTGEMPGVTVIQRSGKPGDSEGTIRVRGIGSFGATPDALILIDGIPGTLNDINPDDIETVSVLKDASTAAIYGARAANGVVLVTTKKGKEGAIKISYNGYVGWQQATKLPELVSSWEYATLYNEAVGREVYTPDIIEKYRNGTDPDNYPNTNFMEDTFTRNGIQTGHDLSLTGGTSSNRYFISFGYLNQNGIVEKNYYKRYNARLNLTSDLTKNLTLTTHIAGAVEEKDEPQTTGNKDVGNIEGIINSAVRYPAIYVGRYQNGDFGEGPENGGTPVSWLASDSYRRRPVTRFNANARLDWKIIEGLTLSGIAGYNFTLSELYSYRASQTLNPRLTLPVSKLDQQRDKEIFKTLQAFAEYTKMIKKHDIDILLGYSFEANDNDQFSGYRQDFPSNDYTVMDMGGGENQSSNGHLEEWAIQSYFGRFKYNYDQKYLFETTVRLDGSSKFPENNKFGTFPSLAVGWRISEESFFEVLRSTLSNLKLKASWGILGNQNISNYPYQSTLSSTLNYSFGGTYATGAGLTLLKDPTLHWESTRTTDIGIESSLFNGLFNLNASYFYRHTYDILYKPSSSVSTVLGLDLSEINTGKMNNTGFEFDIIHQKSFNDFKYKISGNLSIINNKVVDLGVGNVEQPNGLVGNGTDLFIGYPMEMYYGYLSDGVFLDEADIAAWPDQTKVTTNPRAGDIRYKDISGPDGKPDGVVDPTYDRTYVGSRIPKYTYSANLDLMYKGLDLRIFLQGVGNVKGYLSSYCGFAFYNLGTVQKWQMDGRYNPENPKRYVDYPRLEILTNATSGNYVQSDFWVISAAYCRLKNVQLGYTIPKSLLKPLHLEKIRLYFSADNLYTFTGYRKGWDPEINTGGQFYPILATYVFGINANF